MKFNPQTLKIKIYLKLLQMIDLFKTLISLKVNNKPYLKYSINKRKMSLYSHYKTVIGSKKNQNKYFNAFKNLNKNIMT